MLKLEVFSPDGQSKTYELKSFPVSIGRSRKNDIVLTHRTVSRRHAEISKKENLFILRDLGSQNGTFVRKQKIDEAILQNKDVIYIGAYTVNFILEEDVIDLGEKTPEGKKEEEVRLLITETKDIPDRFRSIFRDGLATDIKSNDDTTLSNSTEDTSFLTLPDELLIPKEEFPLLYELQKESIEDDSFEKTLRNITQYLFKRLDADRIALFLDGGFQSLSLAILENRPGIDFENLPFLPFYDLLKQAIANGEAILSNGIDEEHSVLEDEQKAKLRSYSAIFAALKFDEQTAGAIQLETFAGKDKLDKAQLEFICRVIRELSRIIVWKKCEKEKLDQKLLGWDLERIHPVDTIKRVLGKDVEYKKDFFDSKEQVASALVCQMVNLEELQEKLSPVEIQSIMQNFFTSIREAILAYRGSIVEFSSERVLGVFGLPVKQLDSGVRAVLSALRAKREIDRIFNAKNLEIKPVLGCGIQTGVIFGGHIVCDNHHTFFAQGNAIHFSDALARMVTGVNNIFLAPEAYFDVRFYFDTEEIGIREILVPPERIMVYSVVDLKEMVSEESILYLASENADSEITSEEFLRLPEVF